MHPKKIQDWINALDSQANALAISYIKSNSHLLDTNLEEFIENCPPSCERKVREMLLKAGIELPDTSLKQWDKLLSECVKAYKIDYEKIFEDYMSCTLSNKSDWTIIDTSPVLEEIV